MFGRHSWPLKMRTRSGSSIVQPQRVQHAAGLGTAFVQLALRVGVDHDAGAEVVVDHGGWLALTPRS